MARFTLPQVLAFALAAVLASLAGCTLTTETAEKIALDRLCKAYPDSRLCDEIEPPAKP
jgi:hypothetical protein